jgi:hypothetical protein
MQFFIKKYNITRTDLCIYDDIINHYAPLAHEIVNDEENNMVIRCIKLKQKNNESLENYMQNYIDIVNEYNNWIASIRVKKK